MHLEQTRRLALQSTEGRDYKHLAFIVLLSGAHRHDRIVYLHMKRGAGSPYLHITNIIVHVN